ncbi:hypothetical protein G3576_12155 [Roseomonas stagni]|uniref:Uncharacterized protein n=1 Tax=Falsiroseomonas algicola TaxID=2716930 RepID=A0A6M1LKA5_9PROT|nr:hypothetical protein [Falsiroseomonas algicola]NGM20768.1 hypothetical protein [Falsiroseomonas algicola]
MGQHRFPSRYGALLLLALAAMPARAEMLAVATPDGSCTLHAAPDGTAQQLADRLATEAEAIRGMGARLLADAAAMRLAPAREHVPRFGDWAYGWVQSYVTSYRVLARGAVGLADALAGRGEIPDAAAIAEEMAAPIRLEFRNRVLAPALENGGFAADLSHVGAVVDAEWAAVLARAIRALRALPPAPGPASILIDLPAVAQPLAPALLAATPDDPMAVIAEEGSDSSMVFMRSLRPMAARLGAVVVRVSEAGSLVATGGAFGYALAGLPGTVVGLAGGIGASWGIDWLFNKLDATLNRAAFEAQALDAIGNAERRLAAEADKAVAAALQARLDALARRATCP